LNILAVVLAWRARYSCAGESAEGHRLAAARLLVASVGLDNPAGFPRFTFGNAELAGGLTLIRS